MQNIEYNKNKNIVGLKYTEYEELPADSEVKTFYISMKCIVAFHVNTMQQLTSFCFVLFSLKHVWNIDTYNNEGVQKFYLKM